MVHHFFNEVSFLRKQVKLVVFIHAVLELTLLRFSTTRLQYNCLVSLSVAHQQDNLELVYFLFIGQSILNLVSDTIQAVQELVRYSYHKKHVSILTLFEKLGHLVLA